jgi:hypothetical protein
MKKSTGPRVTFDTVRQVALALPGVVEGTSYGTAAFRVRGKFMLRLREDRESIVLKPVNDEEREALLASDPDTFFMTDHYIGYDCILIRFARISRADLKALLERAWRRLASKRLVAAYDAGRFAE